MAARWRLDAACLQGPGDTGQRLDPVRPNISDNCSKVVVGLRSVGRPSGPRSGYRLGGDRTAEFAALVLAAARAT
jgi:hypothetical protein